MVHGSLDGFTHIDGFLKCKTLATVLRTILSFFLTFGWRRTSKRGGGGEVATLP